MESKKDFPLIVYEMTNEAVNLLRDAEERLRLLCAQWRTNGGQYTIAGGSWQFNTNNEPEFWLNDARPFTAHALSVDEAKKSARTFGRYGWWTIKEFEEFLNGTGPIMEAAMEHLGFRRHIKQPGQWARKKASDDPQPSNVIHKPRSIDDPAEAEFLKSLLLMPHEDLGSDRTMDMCVKESGMVFAYLRVNPFGGSSMETMGKWAAGLRVRGHFAKQQDGYVLKAENISIADQNFIHITTEGDCKTKECLWPTSISRDNFIFLLTRFVQGS